MTDPNTAARPIIFLSIAPKTGDDRQSLLRALSDLAQRQPTIRVRTDSTDGQTIVSGTGELQLELICDSLVHEYKIQIQIGKPKVIYLETIRQESEAEGKYIRAISTHCMYGHVKLRLEPLQAGGGYQFVDERSEGVVPREFVEPVNRGIQKAMKGGILAGYEMTDLLAILYDGSYHAGDSNQMAFEIAASIAFKEAARKANPVILEPIMSVEVVTPEIFAGALMGDLSLRRGRIENVESRADLVVIHGLVPMAEMLGYAKHVRSMTHGRASYSMHFASYEPCPRGSELGGNEARVTSHKPIGPKTRSGSAAANPDEQTG